MIQCRPTRRGVRHLLELRLIAENGVVGSASATGVKSVPQTVHVAFCGNYDARILALRDPEPMSAAKRASLLRSVGLIDSPCAGGSWRARTCRDSAPGAGSRR